MGPGHVNLLPALAILKMSRRQAYRLPEAGDIPTGFRLMKNSYLPLFAWQPTTLLGIMQEKLHHVMLGEKLCHGSNFVRADFSL